MQDKILCDVVYHGRYIFSRYLGQTHWELLILLRVKEQFLTLASLQSGVLWLTKSKANWYCEVLKAHLVPADSDQKGSNMWTCRKFTSEKFVHSLDARLAVSEVTMPTLFLDWMMNWLKCLVAAMILNTSTSQGSHITWHLCKDGLGYSLDSSRVGNTPTYQISSATQPAHRSTEGHSPFILGVAQDPSSQ